LGGKYTSTSFSQQSGGDKKVKKKIYDPLKEDPNAPKKPIIQGYLLYYTDVRSQKQKENPTLQNKDLTKVIADDWNKLSKEKRIPYETKAKGNRESYENELRIYLDKNPEMKAKLSKKRRKKASSGGVISSQVQEKEAESSSGDDSDDDGSSSGSSSGDESDSDSDSKKKLKK